MVKNWILNLLCVMVAVVAVGVVVSECNDAAAERMVESPYGPVKPLDFDLYGEYYAGRSFIEYEGSEFGAGVVTDLVLSLTEENIGKKKGETTVQQGFIHYCAPCHGDNGNGEGKFAAATLTPKPANLSDSGYMSTLSDADIVAVVTGGSLAVGKSNLCPPWGMTFDKTWIANIAAYVRSLSAEKTAIVAKVKAVDTTDVATDDEEESNTVRWIILGFATAFFIGVALLEWSWVLKGK